MLITPTIFIILETTVSCLHYMMHTGEAPLTFVARWCIHWLYGEENEIKEAEVKIVAASRQAPKSHHHSNSNANAKQRRPVFSDKS